jgi:hypothetical protein
MDDDPPDTEFAVFYLGQMPAWLPSCWCTAPHAPSPSIRPKRR